MAGTERKDRTMRLTFTRCTCPTWHGNAGHLDDDVREAFRTLGRFLVPETSAEWARWTRDCPETVADYRAARKRLWARWLTWWKARECPGTPLEPGMRGNALEGSGLNHPAVIVTTRDGRNGWQRFIAIDGENEYREGRYSARTGRMEHTFAATLEEALERFQERDDASVKALLARLHPGLTPAPVRVVGNGFRHLELLDDEPGTEPAPMAPNPRFNLLDLLDFGDEPVPVAPVKAPEPAYREPGLPPGWKTVDGSPRPWLGDSI